MLLFAATSTLLASRIGFPSASIASTAMVRSGAIRRSPRKASAPSKWPAGVEPETERADRPW
jgi:hypothetical protein